MHIFYLGYKAINDNDKNKQKSVVLKNDIDIELFIFQERKMNKFKVHFLSEIKVVLMFKCAAKNSNLKLILMQNS